MSKDSEEETDVLENVAELIDGLAQELNSLHSYKDLFFENHPFEMATEKNKLVDKKKDELLEKFEGIDVNHIPSSLRAEFLYLKGRCYNISQEYDARASQCLSKAVRLDPHLVVAWNELGDCYWKNMNVKEAKSSFEGALKHQRNRLSLRCLSIILRQESGTLKRTEAVECVLNSIELAKEAVAQDTKDGISWTVLGNAYLCQFFMVAQDPATLKLCMSAYKQAYQDPIAKGKPDLFYNRGIALKYDECYDEALSSFEHACRLEPPWETPRTEKAKLVQYLASADQLARTKGKLKPKKLQQMVQSLDKKMLGVYGPGIKHKFGSRTDVTLEHTTIASLQEGSNEGKVILGKVVGSIHNEGAPPFTFAMVDESSACVCVTVYNLANGRGPIIGDSVAVPEPRVRRHTGGETPVKYDFKSLRVNNPMSLLVNGKQVGANQFASTRVTSTYET